jgi:hypothetical protein
LNRWLKKSQNWRSGFEEATQKLVSLDRTRDRPVNLGIPIIVDPAP